MACALSESTQLAIAGTEVLESIVRGGLAAPNDVRSLEENNADYSGFLCLWLWKQVQSLGSAICLHEVEFGPLCDMNMSLKELTPKQCKDCLTIENLY
jgi:hypothetical protein